MTNLEYYKKEIIESLPFGLTNEGEFCDCIKISCDKCIFKGNYDVSKELTNCKNNRELWLKKEYNKKPKLTEQEMDFCKSLKPDCYLARDLKDNGLYAYSSKPVKSQQGWGFHNNKIADSVMIYISMYIFSNCSFEFIKWEDEEPWKVSDLLKLEVKR